jgi:protocatechuate 3,4-dioxygenase beta subunit
MLHQPDTRVVLEFSRRRWIEVALLAGATLPIAAKTELTVTDPDDEGPFYKPDAPFRETIFEPGAPGVRLEFEGRVLTSSGEAVPRAIVDLWNADAAGEYDNTGFNLRGRQKADSKGRFRFVTILPKGYGSRTPHLHFKIAAPDQRLLTTQLYFKGEPRNYVDSMVRPSRLVNAAAAGQGRRAEFSFVLRGA